LIDKYEYEGESCSRANGLQWFCLGLEVARKTKEMTVYDKIQGQIIKNC